jgi:F-box domain
MDEGLGIEKLRVDHWQHVSKFLRPNDLCRLMCVSHSFRSMWGSDRFWYHQKDRVCGRFPESEPLFETPNMRIWRILKEVLFKGVTLQGLQQCCESETLQSIVFSVAMLSVPFNEKIRKKKMFKSVRDPMGETPTYNIALMSLSVRLYFAFSPKHEWFALEGVHDRSKNRNQHYSSFDNHHGCPDRCEQWRMFLLQDKRMEQGWNDKLYEIMK